MSLFPATMLLLPPASHSFLIAASCFAALARPQSCQPPDASFLLFKIMPDIAIFTSHTDACLHKGSVANSFCLLLSAQLTKHIETLRDTWRFHMKAVSSGRKPSFQFHCLTAHMPFRSHISVHPCLVNNAMMPLFAHKL